MTHLTHYKIPEYKLKLCYFYYGKKKCNFSMSTKADFP